MIKTTMIKEPIVVVEYGDRLDTKINNFIRDIRAKKIIDIKFTATGQDNRATALVIYEDGEEE